MPKKPPLRADWVERIFARLTMVYGHQFLGRWSGLDIDAIKASWAEELSGFADHPEALAHGLENLTTGEPPTVLEFRALCRPALREERQAISPALPAPRASLERMAELLAKVGRVEPKQSKAWAWALKEREERERADMPAENKRLTEAQRQSWRQALRADLAKQSSDEGETA